MCPLWPFHLFVIYLLILGPLWLVSCAATGYLVKNIPVDFSPEELQLRMGETEEVFVYSEDPEIFKHKWKPETDKEIADVVLNNSSYLLNFNSYNNWTSAFNVTGNFLGKTSVKLRSVDGNGSVYELEKTLNVTVVLGKRTLDKVFTLSMVVLVSVLYILFGNAMDWPVVTETVKKPIAPLIGFVSQFLFMPLMSYALGKLFFPCSAVMRLGLFFTGISPGGGASNMWCAAMNANVNLSVTMTAISIVAAFFMYPLWLYTLGRYIFEEANLMTPNAHIAYYLILLIVPLGIGCGIQHYCPRLGKILNKLLQPVSIFLIIFIVILASYTKRHLFYLFTWRVVLAGLALPWLGYAAGFLAAWALRQPMENVLAIAIETGVQNTGIAIFMITVAFSQPTADITSVIPVSVAVMAPIPLSICSIALKLKNRLSAKTWKYPLEDGREIAYGRAEQSNK